MVGCLPSMVSIPVPERKNEREREIDEGRRGEEKEERGREETEDRGRRNRRGERGEEEEGREIDL